MMGTAKTPTQSPEYRFLRTIVEVGFDLVTGGLGGKLVTAGEQAVEIVKKWYGNQAEGQVINDWSVAVHQPELIVVEAVDSARDEILGGQRDRTIREEVRGYVLDVLRIARRENDPPRAVRD